MSDSSGHGAWESCLGGGWAEGSSPSKLNHPALELGTGMSLERFFSLSPPPGTGQICPDGFLTIEMEVPNGSPAPLL